MLGLELHCQCSCLCQARRWNRLWSSRPTTSILTSSSSRCWWLLLSGPTECLISLHQCQPSDLLPDKETRQWTAAEIELVMADQVGTAIAHATLTKSWNSRLQARNPPPQKRVSGEYLPRTRTLNGMLGFKADPGGHAEEQQEFIEEAYRSALHLLNIINDILDIAKIEAGKMELQLGPVKLDELFSALDFTSTQAKQKNLSCRFLCLIHPIIVHGNYQRLLQVVLNLVSNALKFTLKVALPSAPM